MGPFDMYLFTSTDIGTLNQICLGITRKKIVTRDALPNLVSFGQSQKGEKHPRRSVTLS